MKTEHTVGRAVTALALATIFWGLSFPLIRMSNMLIDQHFSHSDSASTKFDNEFASATASTVLRFGIALAVLAVCFPSHFRRMTAAHWVMGAVAGAVYSAGLFLQVVALNDIPASRSGFLTSLMVVFTPLLMIAVERRLPSIRGFLSAACAVIGVAILTNEYKIGLGDALTLLGALLFSFQVILVDIFSRRMPPVLITPGMFAATFVVALVSFMVHDAVRSPAVPLAGWVDLVVVPGYALLTVAIAIVCTVLPFFLMNKYQARITPAQAALIYTLEPVFVTGWAMWLPGVLSPLLGIDYPAEMASWALVGGGGFVLAANMLGFSSTPRG